MNATLCASSLGKLADLGFIRPQNELRDRLDGLRAPRLHVHERIVIFDAGVGHSARDFAFARIDEVRGAGLILQLKRGDVAANARERRDHYARFR